MSRSISQCCRRTARPWLEGSESESIRQETLYLERARQTSEDPTCRLEEDDDPGNQAESRKEGFEKSSIEHVVGRTGPEESARVIQDERCNKEHAKEGELDVPDPKAWGRNDDGGFAVGRCGRRAFEDALKVGRGEAGRSARADDGEQTESLIALGFVVGRVGEGGALELDDADARCEDDEREPLLC